MASTKKKVIKKKAVKKQVVKKQVVKKTAVKKAVTKKAPANKTPVKKSQSEAGKIKVTIEQRHKMICEAAYYISLEKSYETVNPTEDWLQAEAAIRKICTLHSK